MPAATSHSTLNPARECANGSTAIGHFHSHLEQLEDLVSALFIISGQATEALGQDQSQLGGALRATVQSISTHAARLLEDADKMVGNPISDPAAATAEVRS